MRLLLVNPNRAREPFPVPPLGLAWVAAAARRAGHAVRLLDLAFGEWRPKLDRALAEFEPEAVGLGVRNVDNALFQHYQSYLPHLREVAAALRDPARPLILGGPGFSIFPAELLEALGADYGLVGEGEEALPLLLGRLEAGRDASDVPGLVWRGNGRPDSNPARPPRSLDQLPQPEHYLIDYARYEAAAGYAAIQTKRGCPCRCIYCSYPQLEGGWFRLRPPEAVGEELSTLVRCGVRHVFFTDSVFNLPQAYAEVVCAEILRRRLPLRWMAYCNPRGLTLELARLMRRSGCLGVELGIDSASDAMLERLGKGFTQADIVAASQALRQAGIPQALYCLVGGPGEDLSTIRDSLGAIGRHTRPQFVAVNVGLRVLPGTPLAGLVGTPEADGPWLVPRFYLSPGVDAAALAELERLCRANCRCASPSELRHPFTRALIGLMVRARVRPFWRHAWLNGWQRRLFFWVGP